jgi:hypothetical protein
VFPVLFALLTCVDLKKKTEPSLKKKIKKKMGKVVVELEKVLVFSLT